MYLYHSVRYGYYSDLTISIFPPPPPRVPRKEKHWTQLHLPQLFLFAFLFSPFSFCALTHHACHTDLWQLLYLYIHIYIPIDFLFSWTLTNSLPKENFAVWPLPPNLLRFTLRLKTLTGHPFRTTSCWGGGCAFVFVFAFFGNTSHRSCPKQLALQHSLVLHNWELLLQAQFTLSSASLILEKICSCQPNHHNYPLHLGQIYTGSLDLASQSLRIKGAKRFSSWQAPGYVIAQKLATSAC